MFRFFDKDFSNSVSYKEFRIVCEELDMRLPIREERLIFDYMDKD
jgi:Ca2+-binding EF-hand superfamily protein